MTSSPAPNSPDFLLLLDSGRAGELAQLRLIADSLGLPVVVRPSQSLPCAPWPRVVLSFGADVRTAVALRRASGGRVPVIQLGRSRGARQGELALQIAMPQDCVPAGGNVLQLRMALNRTTPPAPEQVTALGAALAALPRPWTAVLVGGESRHTRFTASDARRLAAALRRHRERLGGSLLVTTSPRTGLAATAALREALGSEDCWLYDWRPNDQHNPLAALLALADGLVVTGDSGSMLAEAWRSGKPVWVAPLPAPLAPGRRLRRALHRLLPAALHRPAIARGWVSAPVDLPAWLSARIADGTFARLGSARPPRPYAPELDTEFERVIAAIRARLDAAC